MKILVATVPASGHAKPLTGVAARLVEQGHDVRWYTSPTYVPMVEALGATAVPYERAREITGENIADLFPERARLKGPRLISFDFARVFTDNIAAQVADIRALHQTFGFERLVIDEAFYAATIIGPSLEVPVHAVNPGVALIPSRDVPPPFFGLRPARNAIGRGAQAVIRTMVHSSMREGLVGFNAARADAGLAPLATSDVLGSVAAIAARVYQTGIPETDYPRTDAPPNLEYVGELTPWRGHDAPPVDPRVREWSGRVVVVSQGTVDNRDARKLLAPTIEALTGDPSTLVVGVTGGVGTKALRSRYAAPNVLVEDYLEFDSLLPQADVFVGNGGHGSVLQALRHGVPLVVAGRREGKNDINSRLAWNGLGIDLRTEKPSARSIRRAVDRATADETLHLRVARVADRLRSLDGLDLATRGITGTAQETPARRPAVGA